MSGLELWGGHECTVNRVGDRYRDQTKLTGHQDRIGDLARFAELGITKLRYPVTWERVAPDRPDDHDWRWSDERLAEIRRLGMKPIVGLLHHGSGPRYTSLVCDGFVGQFASYAAAVARRYPEVTDWTPVNEPLTTARFSALYGHWYPHAQDEGLFWRALLNQVDGTRAAMKAIRRVNPAARLIQTEDLGQHFSTDRLAATADYYNHRRWATWDLLTGRVTHDHALWPQLDALGLGDRLRAIADEPCPPDVIGVNYYPTSERFLDHRLDAYPYDPPAEGYHDLTAIRVLDPPTPGLSGLLKQAWDRYHIPLALTESHLGCTREEQLRWLWQSWQTCRDLAADGIPVRAFTAWALLGNVDWTSLITVEAGHYENGAFDVRSGVPRPTAIAQLLAVLGRGEEPVVADFPTLNGPGWWQRGVRLEHGAFAWSGSVPAPCETASAVLTIAGEAGPLAEAFGAECEMRGLPHVRADRAVLPIGDADGIAAYLEEHRPWALIVTDPLEADRYGPEPRSFGRTRGDHIAALAAACTARGIRCLLFSPDMMPAIDPGALVIQSPALPPHAGTVRQDRSNFSQQPVEILGGAGMSRLVANCLDLLVDHERGIWHVTDIGLEMRTKRLAAA